MNDEAQYTFKSAMVPSVEIRFIIGSQLRSKVDRNIEGPNVYIVLATIIKFQLVRKENRDSINGNVIHLVLKIWG